MPIRGQGMAKDINIKISQLVLDIENPRIESEAGQLNIRQAVIDDQGTKIAELAGDIVEHGLNPMDRMMLLQPDPLKKEYICLEGNRRTAALQLLNKPELMSDLVIPDSFRSKITDLADEFDKSEIEPIRAVLVPDRESARRWIELRHTGENEGRGIVDWNGVQTARFRGDKTLDLLDFVREHGSLDDKQEKALVRNFPITTLDRIVSNPAVRQKIGLQIIDGKFYVEYDGDKILPLLKRIVLDLAMKAINVTAVKKSDQQIDYVKNLPSGLFPKTPKLKTPVYIKDAIKVVTPAPKPVPPSPPPPPPSPLSRKTLIPKGVSLAITNQKAAQIFYELQQLNLDRFPIAGALLLRSLIEAGIEIYTRKHSLPKNKTSGKNAGKALSLTERVSQSLMHLKGASTLNQQQINAAKDALVNESSVISIKRLHEYVHNPSAFPSKSDLIGSWSAIEDYLASVFK